MLYSFVHLNLLLSGFLFLQASALIADICQNLRTAAKSMEGVDYTVVLRGDSTLRGHFPEARTGTSIIIIIINFFFTLIFMIIYHRHCCCCDYFVIYITVNSDK